MTRILVTGAAGFIGTTLTARLLDAGHQVVGIDALTSSYSPAIKSANLASLAGDRFRFVRADLAADDIDAVVADADAIVHLAGRPGVRSSWGSGFESYLHDNVLATQRLLESIVRAGSTAHLINASSSSVYGQYHGTPASEADALRPYSPYGATKLTAEHLVSAYVDNFGVAAISFRLFTVYGPRQRPDMAFQRFLTAVAAGDPVPIYGSGDQIRDFTFVGDVVDAIQLALESHGAMPTVMNISGGSSTSVKEVLDLIEDITGLPIVIENHPVATGDVDRTGGDSSTALSTLNWTPHTTLREGLVLQWEHMLSHRSSGLN